MADDGTTVNLDKAWLENFLNHDILNFRDALKKITRDGLSTTGEVIPSLENLSARGKVTDDWPIEATRPLMIGYMADNETVNGAALVEAVTNLIKELVPILDNQVQLFEDIEDNLRTSIEELFEAQGENLTRIDGDKLLDIFEDVDDTLGEAGSGGEDD